jgi:phage tail-like protein
MASDGLLKDEVNAQGTTVGRLNTDPIRNFKFIIHFYHSFNDTKFPGNERQRLASMGFMNMSGLAQTTTVIPYREGGNNTTERKLPGQTSFGDITFAQGVTFKSTQPWAWTRQIFSVNNGQGNHNGTGDFRTNASVFVMGHPHTSSTIGTGRTPPRAHLKFRLYRCWITGIAFSELDAGGNAVMVQQMTIAHEGFEMNVASSVISNLG